MNGEELIQNTCKEVDLPDLLKQFSYPVSLELSEYVGRKVYQKGFADPLEFLCLMATKFYTRIRQEPRKQHILESFIKYEGGKIQSKTKVLIEAVKKWEMGVIGDSELGKAIDKFCETYGVGLPTVSFFLRMSLPQKFGTLDIHTINSLKSLGFQISVYDGQSYLKYNRLLTAIGLKYNVPSELGGQRRLTPSEVDMALYQYDKSKLKTPRCFGSFGTGYRPMKDCIKCVWKEKCEDLASEYVPSWDWEEPDWQAEEEREEEWRRRIAEENKEAEELDRMMGWEE